MGFTQRRLEADEGLRQWHSLEPPSRGGFGQRRLGLFHEPQTSTEVSEGFLDLVRGSRTSPGEEKTRSQSAEHASTVYG
jgi:hypothetical protein